MRYVYRAWMIRATCKLHPAGLPNLNLHHYWQSLFYTGDDKTFIRKLIHCDSLIALPSSHVIVTSVDDSVFVGHRKLFSLYNRKLKTGMIYECIGALTVIAGEFDEPFHHC
ncbi:hypothetical protein [Escherichia marmotae]|uniref:hypothetical protein n=1 Tax=Escherichia marmotae TaxID=1499973 RepID=UPI000F837148|nr:hypothetical protein [Escherichia marmotae]